MAGASCTQAVAVADGRTLTIAEWGDPGGFPVFLLHGTPGSRFVGQADESAYASVGARVITYDRPVSWPTRGPMLASKEACR
jgi:pimeloyl-ACP methyl ester carboxylesterase